jgi:S-adenosylmethionine:tRNA ribosyltransferase-isomerase
METAELDYDLPAEFIAQTPLEPRDSSRLMYLPRAGGFSTDHNFTDLQHLLRAGDLLVFNDTRVLAARVAARKQTGGKVELLLLRALGAQQWIVLAGGRGVTAGTVLELAGSGEPVQARVLQVLQASARVVEFSQPVETWLDSAGSVPLPPYIHAPLRDPERYQTVYARHPGSAAAPTAGLHFTPALLDKLLQCGIDACYVTLHVGLDTFKPISATAVDAHAIHSEWCKLSAGTAAKIAATRAAGGRVVAVGTTSARVVESAAAASAGSVREFEGQTRLFVKPGFEYRAVDGLITNFHLPRSTLLLMVAAFCGKAGLPRVLQAYTAAMQAGYRFYSFGDAMLIV